VREIAKENGIETDRVALIDGGDFNAEVIEFTEKSGPASGKKLRVAFLFWSRNQR
jgi:hypothetical protein